MNDTDLAHGALVYREGRYTTQEIAEKIGATPTIVLSLIEWAKTCPGKLPPAEKGTTDETSRDKPARRSGEGGPDVQRGGKKPGGVRVLKRPEVPRALPKPGSVCDRRIEDDRIMRAQSDKIAALTAALRNKDAKIAELEACATKAANLDLRVHDLEATNAAIKERLQTATDALLTRDRDIKELRRERDEACALVKQREEDGYRLAREHGAMKVQCKKLRDRVADLEAAPAKEMTSVTANSVSADAVKPLTVYLSPAEYERVGRQYDDDPDVEVFIRYK